MYINADNITYESYTLCLHAPNFEILRHIINYIVYCSFQLASGGGRERRATHTVAPPLNDTIADNADAKRKVYRIYEMHATEFITFVKVRSPDTFLIVRNIQHRLVITLPYTIHNLKLLRFFMVLQGVGKDNVTYGNLAFHQDQPHINLFVFFSVFFSCFFLFLAICVLIWKSKQAVDVHRSRHRQRIQMEHMASRPFGKVLVLLDPSTTPLLEQELPGATGGDIETLKPVEELSLDTGNSTDVRELSVVKERPISPTIIIAPKLRGGGGRRALEATSPTSITSLVSVSSGATGTATAPTFHVSPIALEPMDDGVATIGTVLMQLPGGTSAPMQMSLASALISMRVLYPSHGAVQGGAGPCRGDGGHHGSKVGTLIYHRGSSTA